MQGYCVYTWPFQDGCKPHSTWLWSKIERCSHSIVHHLLSDTQSCVDDTVGALMMSNFRLQFSPDSLTSSHQSLSREGRWGTTDDFATSSLQFSLFSTALWDLPNSRPVHSLMLSSHLFLYLPCLLPPFTVPCRMVLARPDERET